MAKVRIYELAKKLNRNTKDILDELADMGFEGKSHSSSIDESIADKIARALAAAEPAEPLPPIKEEVAPISEISKEPAAAPERTTELAAEAVAEVTSLVIAHAWSGTAIVTKTASTGLSIVDAAAGRIDVELSGSDTDLLEGEYKYELQITDSASNRSTPLYGLLSIVTDLINPTG